MTTVTGFPNSAQTEFARISKAPLPGSLWEEAFWAATPLNGLLPRVTEVAFVKTLTISANNPGDEVGINLEGGEILVPSGVDATATALALSDAIAASGFAATYIADQVPALAVVTITGVLGQDPTIVESEKGATQLAIGVTTAAVLQPIVTFGEGVVAYDNTGGINDNKFRRPSAVTDKFMGVVLRTSGAKLPAGQLGEYDPDLSVDNCTPGFAYSVERRNVGVVVEYVSTEPTVVDDVYLVMSGADAGKWRINDGSVAGTNEVATITVASVGGTAGVSQVSTLTLTSVADGNIGFSYDGLPALALAATANIINDAASLNALYLANASYMAITTSIVDNLDGTLTITFNDSALHTFADASTGTSSIAENIDVANVAFVAGDALAFNYDGLPDLTVAAATGVVATDAAALYVQWLASAAYAALGSIVDNLDGTLTITFADFTTHVLTDNSGGTSTITEVVDTAAVAAIAATAVLREEFSWGKPSITASADVPARAFLRLSRA